MSINLEDLSRFAKKEPGTGIAPDLSRAEAMVMQSSVQAQVELERKIAKERAESAYNDKWLEHYVDTEVMLASYNWVLEDKGIAQIETGHYAACISFAYDNAEFKILIPVYITEGTYTIPVWHDNRIALYVCLEIGENYIRKQVIRRGDDLNELGFMSITEVRPRWDVQIESILARLDALEMEVRALKH